jgi:hypothetical protein
MEQYCGCLTIHSGFGPCTHAADAGRGNPTCCQSQALGDKAQSREDSTTVQKEREREVACNAMQASTQKAQRRGALLFLLASW